MTNINNYILHEMQDLSTMMSCFQQAISLPNIDMSQFNYFDPNTIQQDPNMQDPNTIQQDLNTIQQDPNMQDPNINSDSNINNLMANN